MLRKLMTLPDVLNESVKVSLDLLRIYRSMQERSRAQNVNDDELIAASNTERIIELRFYPFDVAYHRL
jgi:hypothetical protein